MYSTIVHPLSIWPSQIEKTCFVQMYCRIKLYFNFLSQDFFFSRFKRTTYNACLLVPAHVPDATSSQMTVSSWQCIRHLYSFYRPRPFRNSNYGLEFMPSLNPWGHFVQSDIFNFIAPQHSSVRQRDAYISADFLGQPVILRSQTPYDMIWYDMIWYDMIWYDMIWYDMIWYDMIWYDMIW
jgi:hypothetical protein